MPLVVNDMLNKDNMSIRKLESLKLPQSNHQSFNLIVYD